MTAPDSGSPIATGSGLERAMECDASNVLPRVWSSGNVYSDRGQELHAYLQRITDGATPEESLAQVADEHRDWCEGMDLEGLKLEQYSAEVTLVVNLPTGRGRVLGANLQRDYTGVGPDDVPMTIDLVGVDLPARRGELADHKSGFSKRTPAAENWQLLGPAVALASVYDLDEITGKLIMHREGKPPFVDRATFTPSDLVAARGELAALHQRTIANRARYERGEHIEPTEGPWCAHCPCAYTCPAKIGTIRAALAFDENTQIIPADAGKLLDQIERAMAALKAVKSRIYGLAAIEPMLLEVYEDGAERWLGDAITDGNEDLDPNVAIDVGGEVLKVPADEAAAFVRSIAKLKVTKAALRAEVMRRAPKKKGGKTFDAVLDAVRAKGGAPRKVRTGVQVYELDPAQAAARRRQHDITPAGPPDDSWESVGEPPPHPFDDATDPALG